MVFFLLIIFFWPLTCTFISRRDLNTAIIFFVIFHTNPTIKVASDQRTGINESKTKCIRFILEQYYPLTYNLTVSDFSPITYPAATESLFICSKFRFR